MGNGLNKFPCHCAGTGNPGGASGPCRLRDREAGEKKAVKVCREEFWRELQRKEAQKSAEEPFQVLNTF